MLDLSVSQYRQMVDSFFQEYSYPVVILGVNAEILYKNRAATIEFGLSEELDLLPIGLDSLRTCLLEASRNANGYTGSCEYIYNKTVRHYQCTVTSAITTYSSGRIYLCILNPASIPSERNDDKLIASLPVLELDYVESESEQQWRHSIEGAQAGVWHLNLSNRKVRWSRRMLSLYGLSSFPQDYDSALSYISDTDRERIANEIEKAILNHSLIDVEYTIILPDGSLRWIESKGRVIYDQNGTALHIEGIAFDITSKKRIEQEIYRTREFSQKALDSLDGIFYIISDEGKFLAWNQSFENVSGYSADEISELHPTEFFRNDDVKRIEERIAKVFNTGSAMAEADFYSRDGTCRHYYFTGKLVEYEGKPCLIGMGIDISEKKQLEAQLFQAQKMEGIGRLAGGIAHDFNNLLSVILGYTELLEKETISIPAVYDGIHKIQTTASRAGHLTSQLLTLARKQPSKPKVVDMNRLIESMKDLLTPLVGGNIQLQTVLHPDILHVNADPVQLEQVLVNLIVNARDALAAKKNGCIEIKTTMQRNSDDLPVDSKTEQDKEYVLVTVTDNGEGMDANVLSQAYDPFFTTKETGKGTGLGLSICYGIVRQHDGHISISSTPGEGTKVKVHLPLVKETTEVETQENQTVTDTARYTILVAEDEPMLRELTVQTLSSAGYHILQAEDGSEALELASNYPAPIHILLSDLMMPRKGGKELAAQLLQLRPAMKVLFVSGYAETLYEKDGIPSFDYKLLHKPYSGKALREQVSLLLNSAAQDAN